MIFSLSSLTLLANRRLLSLMMAASAQSLFDLAIDGDKEKSTGKGKDREEDDGVGEPWKRGRPLQADGDGDGEEEELCDFPCKLRGE